MSQVRRRRGLTLPEVLVALGIVVVALLFIVPAVHRVREANLHQACSRNLRDLMLAMANDEMIGTSSKRADRLLPIGCMGAGTVAEERLSWMVALLPYLDHEQLYKEFDTAKGFQDNLQTAQTQINQFQCGKSYLRQGDAITHYVAMAGIGVDAAERPAGAKDNGFIGYDRRTTWSMIKDGASNTIALVETRSNLGPWAQGGTSNLRGFDPTDLPVYGDQRPFGGHDRGFKVAMADGSVRNLNSDIDPKRLRAAITIAGGELLSLESY